MTMLHNSGPGKDRQNRASKVRWGKNKGLVKVIKVDLKGKLVWRSRVLNKGYGTMAFRYTSCGTWFYRSEVNSGKRVIHSVVKSYRLPNGGRRWVIWRSVEDPGHVINWAIIKSISYCIFFFINVCVSVSSFGWVDWEPMTILRVFQGFMSKFSKVSYYSWFQSL